jgi:hypothetical protein
MIMDILLKIAIGIVLFSLTCAFIISIIGMYFEDKKDKN